MWRFILGFWQEKSSSYTFFDEKKHIKQKKTIMLVSKRETVGFQFVYDFRWRWPRCICYLGPDRLTSVRSEQLDLQLQNILCVGTEDFKLISKTKARDVRTRFRNDLVFPLLTYMADWKLLHVHSPINKKKWKPFPFLIHPGSWFSTPGLPYLHTKKNVGQAQ